MRFRHAASLVGAKCEWLLGRVEPGARKTLRLPDEALADDAGSMQLAVVIGERVTVGADMTRRDFTGSLASILTRSYVRVGERVAARTCDGSA